MRPLAKEEDESAVRGAGAAGGSSSTTSSSSGGGGGGDGNNGGGGNGDSTAAPGAPGPTAEMKRRWVRPAALRAGLGRALAAAAAGAARARGYKSIVLDTLERLEAANRVYQGLGFRRRGAYYHNPLPNVVYWELDL